MIIPLDLSLQSGTYKFISKSGNYKLKKVVDIEVTENRLFFEFGYDEYLKDEIKVMDGARWDPDKKCWHAKNNRHNLFQIAYLRGLNPYAQYEQSLSEYDFRLLLYPQQAQMAREGLTYRQTLWAAEMGLGKTASAFSVIENSDAKIWWWIGPRSAIASYEVELDKWGIQKNEPTRVMTYEGLVKLLKDFPKNEPIPQGLILDEISRAKTIDTQRTKAVFALTDKMRDVYGENTPYIIGMTGTPAPKSPADWFSLCEIIKPGFVREGDIYKFKNRLAYIEKKENQQTGGFYPQLIGWKDGSDRCGICGREKLTHDLAETGMTHDFVPGSDEVSRLYRRMKGLVSVYYKKDWMKFLPDKQYRILRCKPSRALVNAAKIVKDTSRTTIEALTRLRELSDGFQYKDKPSGNYETCGLCNGSTRVMIPDYGDEELAENIFDVKMKEVTCTNCGGEGKVETIVRITDSVSSPKDDLLEEIIEDHEDDGRLVVFGGFTGTIDRIQEIFVRKGWEVIRVDGRGWYSSNHSWTTPKMMLQGFQDTSKRTGLSKLAYIGHPQSGGMGVTLTKSHEIVFFSNDFNAESRIQAEDRCHRPGMDLEKGCMITDLVNLDSDLYILDNLKEKRRLQDMSLGKFQESMTLEYVH